MSNFQGRLTDVAGVPQAGPFDFQFLYYDAPAAGTLLLTEQQLGVTVTSGSYDVMLGSGTLTMGTEATFAGVFANHGNVYLEVQVKAGGGPTYDVLSPRTQIAAVPFAVNADKLDGLDASAFAPASGSANYAPASGSPNYAPATGSANYVAKAGDTMAGALNLPADGLRVGGSQLAAAGGNVAIGVGGPPLARLHIDGGGSDILRADTLGTTRLLLTPAGDLAIGLPTPAARLDVGTLGFPATPGLIVRGDAAQSANLIEVRPAAGPSTFKVVSDGSLEVFSPALGATKHRLDVGAAGDSFLCNDPGTRLGIGTALPSSRLSVNGGADISGIVGIGTSSPAPTALLHLANGGTPRSLQLDSAANADGMNIEWRNGGLRHWNIDQLGTDLRFFTEDAGDAAPAYRLVLTDPGFVGVGVSPAGPPECPLDIATGSTDPQLDVLGLAPPDPNFPGYFLPYGGEKADLALVRRASATPSLNGYPASLLDFRAATPAGEASVAQVLSVLDMGVAAGGMAGGLAFLTSPGGPADPAGRRNRGAAPVTRMVIDAKGLVGIGAVAPEGALDVFRGGGLANPQADPVPAPPTLGASAFLLPYGSEKPDLILSRQLSVAAGPNGERTGSLIDFRGVDPTGAEGSIAQVLAVWGLGVPIASPPGGGLAFLTAPPAAPTDPPGRRSAGNAPITRMVIDTNGYIGVNTLRPEGAVDVNRGTADPQVDAGPFGPAPNNSLPYGSEKADLVLARQLAPNPSLNGFPGPLVDFRVTTPIDEWSAAQIVASGDPNPSGPIPPFRGGLAFLTCPGGVTDPLDRRTKGDFLIPRMLISDKGNVGIGSKAPDGALEVVKGQDDPQANAAAGPSLPYGSEKADLVLTRRVSSAASFNPTDYPTALIDFRSTSPTDEWSSAQILATADTSFGGGLAFLTSPGGAANPPDRRTKGVAPVARMYISPTGAVGIGVNNPGFQLQLSADSAAKPGTSTWTVASDRRLKDDIRPFTDGLGTLRRIDPVCYTLNGKGGMPKGLKGIGVIAQDMKDVAPYTVSTFRAKLNPDDPAPTELYNFNSSALTYVTVNAVKELAAENEALRAELRALRAELGELRTMISSNRTAAGER